MRNQKQIKYIIFIILLILTTKLGFTQTDDDNYRSLLIFNVLDKITWQNEDTIDVFKVGVFSGSKDSFLSMKATVEENKHHGIPIEIIYFNRFRRITYTHVLYVANDRNTDVNRINKLLENSQTLLITDRVYDEDNCMINIMEQGGERGINVTNKNLVSHNLTADNSLLYHGGNIEELKKVISDNIAELELQEAELQESIEANNKQKEEIVIQKKEIDEQLLKIKEQTDKIEGQNEKLNLLIKDLEIQRKKLDDNLAVLNQQETLILDKQKELKTKATELKTKATELKTKEEEFNIIEKETKEKQKELNLIEDKLNEANETIDKDKGVINDAKEQIETQKGIIVIVIVFLVFVILAIILFWRALKINKKINSKLNIKNTEIKQQNEEIQSQAFQLELNNIELEKLSIVARETDNAILILDAKGNFEWVNLAFTKIFGFTYEELIKKDKNIIGKNTDKKTIELINKTLIYKKTTSYQFKSVTKNNENIWIQAMLTPILNEEGAIEKIIAVDTDITKVKIAELEIRDKNEELHQQKEKIELQNKQIYSSIKYAQTIQTAILPIKSEMDKHLESIVIYLPKDIVSGDYYWFSRIEKENKSFIAAIDCTGHGVPGAFMSMISSRLMNEIVNEREVFDPKEVLRLVDEGVIKALKQRTSSNNDGLDMCLCVIEKDDAISNVWFAGAKRPIFVSKKNQDYLIIKGTRRSIGGVKRIRNKAYFETKHLQLSKGDTLYLTTDGYMDQNNFKRKKFGTLSFIAMLNKIKEETLSTQKKILEIELFKHMKDVEQRDDITVIGLKL